MRRPVWKPTEQEMLHTVFVMHRKHGDVWFVVGGARERDAARAAASRGWLLQRAPSATVFRVTPEGMRALAPYLEAVR